jgi:hypothetical protein
MRQHLLDLGPVVHTYLTELTHRRPRLWVHDVERLHALLQRHGVDPTRTAIAQGLDTGLVGAEYIAHFLQPTEHSLPLPTLERLA